MNKLFKYILKGKREEFTVAGIIGRVVILLMLGTIIFIVSFLGVMYMEGKREEKAFEYIEEKREEYTEKSLEGKDRSKWGTVLPPVYTPVTILPKRLSDALKQDAPQWFVENTNILHQRYRYIDIWNLNLNDHDLSRFSCFRYLETLNLNNNRISDLTPLKGLPIKELHISGTDVTDLSPLKGMPLEILDISNTEVKDLSALRGMPLKTIDLDRCRGIKDLSILTDFSELQGITVPDHIKDEDVEFLKRLPKIKRITKRDRSSGRPLIRYLLPTHIYPE